MLDRLKDRDVINQWYPAVRHQAILEAAELADPGSLLIYVLYLISHSLMSSKCKSVCCLSLTFKMRKHVCVCVLQFLMPN